MTRVLISIAAVLLCAPGAAPQTPDNQGDNDLVTIACAVSDRSGMPVRNLTPADFRLTDNGQAREVRSVAAPESEPLTVAIVADVSGTQQDYIADHRAAIGQFLKELVGARDRVIIVQLARQAWLLADSTGPSPSAIDAAVEKIGVHQTKQTNLVGPACRNARTPHTCGESALWHGLYHTVLRLKPVAGRKAVIVLSDGVDTGSDRTQADVIEAAQTAGVVFYSLKYSAPKNLGSIRKVLAETFNKGLQHLDGETGGLTFPSPGEKLAEPLSRIASDLRSTYLLTFIPPPDARDGRFHKLDVKATRANLIMRTRTGYRAPNER